MELINGIHIDVPGDEMKTIFEGRLQYHRNKVAVIEKQLTQLRKADAELAEEAEDIGKVSNSSMAGGLEQSLKKHSDQTVYYKFLVEHVVVGATYRLNQSELITLGIQPGQLW